MNEMDALLILGLALLLLSAFLLCRLAMLRRSVRRLAGTLADIRKNGLQRRPHLGFSSGPVKMLGTELNRLIDMFQSAMDEKQRLERSHKRLIANISHDIRTPLTSLLGYLEVLDGQQLPLEERKEYLDVAYAKAMSISRMVEAFFDLASLESEDAAVELENVDLAEIVRETLASFYQDFIRASVTPEILLPAEPVTVQGNRAGIERILYNLLSNALKYGADGGMIGVSMREDADFVWVVVRDRGHGISESDLPHVFDRLYTADTSRNAAFRGAGLGLAIARQLVEKQGGSMTAESVLGEYTVFSFCLRKVVRL
jgi:two-component system, OmpR family, phosphate regulon sensor histidine kinase PhoR